MFNKETAINANTMASTHSNIFDGFRPGFGFFQNPQLMKRVEYRSKTRGRPISSHALPVHIIMPMYKAVTANVSSQSIRLQASSLCLNPPFPFSDSLSVMLLFVSIVCRLKTEHVLHTEEALLAVGVLCGQHYAKGEAAAAVCAVLYLDVVGL